MMESDWIYSLLHNVGPEDVSLLVKLIAFGWPRQERDI
jgi:hypothetical protein